MDELASIARLIRGTEAELGLTGRSLATDENLREVFIKCLADPKKQALAEHGGFWVLYGEVRAEMEREVDEALRKPQELSEEQLDDLAWARAMMEGRGRPKPEIVGNRLMIPEGFYGWEPPPAVVAEHKEALRRAQEESKALHDIPVQQDTDPKDSDA